MGARVYGQSRGYTNIVPPTPGHTPGRTRPDIRGALGKSIEATPRFTILYDGTSGMQGLPSVLGPNEAWIDCQSLYEAEMQQGITLVYEGPGTCDVYGCQLPRHLVADLESSVSSVSASAYAVAGPAWQTIASLAPNVPLSLTAAKPGIIYTILKFEFSASDPGAVYAMAK